MPTIRMRQAYNFIEQSHYLHKCMKVRFLNRTKKCIKEDLITNEDIRQEVNVEELTKKIKDYRNIKVRLTIRYLFLYIYNE